jgi:hypothetical protein
VYPINRSILICFLYFYNDSLKTWKLTKDDFFVRFYAVQYQSCSSFRQEIWFCIQQSKKKSSLFRNEQGQRDSAIPLSETEIENVLLRHKPLLFAFDCCIQYVCVQFNFVVFCDIGYGTVIEMLWNMW